MKEICANFQASPFVVANLEVTIKFKKKIIFLLNIFTNEKFSIVRSFRIEG